MRWQQAYRKKSTRRAGILFLCLLLLFGSQSFQKSQAADFPELEQRNKFFNDLLSSVSWSNGQSAFDAMFSAAAALNDYSMETSMIGHMKERFKVGGAKFFFKQKNRIRIEVTKGAMTQGSIIVRTETGEVKGCGGGVLRFVKMNLVEDSRMLQLPSGRSVVNTDFTTLFTDMKARLKKGAKIKLADSIMSPKWKSPVKVLHIVEGPFDSITDRIIVNPKTNIPLEWDIYRDDGLLSATSFENFQGNTGLQDSLFDL